MNSRESLALLSLWLRWITHDVANPLSAVRSGLEMGAQGMELAAHGADQLTALTHCLRLIAAAAAAAQDDEPMTPAPQEWFAPLAVLAQGRDVVLEVHPTSPSFSVSSSISFPVALAGLLTSFALPLIGWTKAGGKLMIYSRKNKFYLEATGLSDKTAHHIKEILERQGKNISTPSLDPSYVPFYIACLACQRQAAQIDSRLDDDKFIVLLSFPEAQT